MGLRVSTSGAPTAQHPSILALLEAHPGESDPKAIIRKLAREKVAYAKQNWWTGPAFDPHFFVSIFGIRTREIDYDIDGEGRILCERNQRLTIEYLKKRLPERQRFTIFHEFAHTLFPDYCKFVPYNHAPNSRQSEPEKKFENLCDVAAAEMLMPLEDFTRDAQNAGPLSITAVHELRKLYQASIDATAHRLVELSNISCAAAFLGGVESESKNGNLLPVNYLIRSTSFKCYMPRGTNINPKSIAVKCLQEDLECTDPIKETWWINGKPRSWLVQAARLPIIQDNPYYPKVLVLLLPTSYAKSKKGIG